MLGFLLEYAAVPRTTLCLILALCSFRALAADGGGTHAEISRIGFEGNSALSASELKAQISLKETPGFLSKFFHKTISEKLGSPDEFLNPVVLADDMIRLRKCYQNRGFFDAIVDSALRYYNNGANVDVTFRIKEGRRSYVDTVIYRGIPDWPETIWEEIRNSPKIVRGDPFNSLILEDEVRRVLDIFENSGFPNCTFIRNSDSSSATRYASTGNVRVTLCFKHNKRYFFGPISVVQDIDTTIGESHRPDITADLVVRHLEYKQGDFYSTEDKRKSEKNLKSIGIFDLRRIDFAIPSVSDTSETIPSRILIRPRDRNELAPELVVSSENDAFNLGPGLAYTNRNFFGDARILTARAKFRTQTLSAFPNYFQTNSDAVSNFEVGAEILQPYLFSNHTNATWSPSYIIDKEKPYKLEIVRSRLAVNNRFAEFTTGQFEWTIETINTKVRAIPLTDLDPESARQLELMSAQYSRQFNSVFSFTIQRDETNDIFSPSDGFLHSLTVQEAGLFPLLVHNLIPNLPYTQFYSASATGRWYFDVSGGHRSSIVALKIRGGIEEKYGESRSDSNRLIPQTNRFYAGGSGSVRGWASRSLIASGDPQLGGDFLLEGSIEHRWNFFQSLKDGWLDKMWLVQFVDVGNLWPTLGSFQFRQFAVAAGIGFRYDTFFGPFRVDWGFRIYNPDDPNHQSWITQRKFIEQTLKEGVFHFGIGHAF
jgi:outer membrane protein insertion porin family